MFLRYHQDLTRDEIHQEGIQGIIFSIHQGNAERIREIILTMPFYLTIIGDLGNMAKYEIEELVSFCQLDGIIVNNDCVVNKVNNCELIINQCNHSGYTHLVQVQNRWYATGTLPTNGAFFCEIK